jgi:anti-sigma B factor antagonist
MAVGVTLESTRRPTEGCPVVFEVKELQPRGATRVYALVGELDLATAPDLRDVLFAAVRSGARRLVLDLADLTFIDATGIGALLAVRQLAMSSDGALAVANVSKHVARIFDITGVAGPLNMRPSVEQGAVAVAE